MEYISNLQKHLEDDDKLFLAFFMQNINKPLCDSIDNNLLLESYNKIKRLNELLFLHLEHLNKIENSLFAKIICDQSKEHLNIKNNNTLEKHFYENEFKNIFKTYIENGINTHKAKNKPNFSFEPIIKTTNIVNGVQIAPLNITLPIINDIKNIPSSFYWYNGDEYNKAGIYTCLTSGFVVKVPFPNLTCINDPNYKAKSLPCKYETIEKCMANKKKIAEIHQIPLMDCNYVHRKERFTKVGMNHRCRIEGFGKHERLTEDINYIDNNDIKRLLMYSTSDNLLSLIWYQNKFHDGNLHLANLDFY